ncbi:MAG: DciA family protein [Elusimicrobiota bacterium]|jgi:hypothetical protein
MALSPIQQEVRSFCREKGLSNHLPLLEKAWQAEMGGWDGQARIVALDNFSLIVEVKSSPAMQEINLRRRELVRRLNRYFQKAFLRDISVRMMSDDN